MIGIEQVDLVQDLDDPFWIAGVDTEQLQHLLDVARLRRQNPRG